jgi:hypothetical protein
MEKSLCFIKETNKAKRAARRAFNELENLRDKMRRIEKAKAKAKATKTK